MGIGLILVALVVVFIGAGKLRGAQNEAKQHLRPAQNPNFWNKLDPDFYQPSSREVLKSGWRGYQIMGLGILGLAAAAILFDVGPSEPVAWFLVLCGVFIVVRGQMKIMKTDKVRLAAAQGS